MFKELFEKFFGTKKNTVSLNIQLERLEQIGISINPDIDANGIFNIFEKKSLKMTHTVLY